jgi:muramidase (phage lysozyme)
LKDQGVVNDFTPHSQDKAAIKIIEWCSAIEDIRRGEVKKAIHNSKLRRQWSSLPGASQQKIEMDEAVNKFNQYVKEYSKK